MDPMSNSGLGKVMVLGSRGMVGSAVIRRLLETEAVADVIGVCRDDVDLTNQTETFQFIAAHKPDWVVVAAAKVGGIFANNTYPRDFIYDNLAIQLNAIEGSYRAGVEKLIFLGSSCIYPKYAEQPITEEMLLTGILETTNEPYAIAKIAGIKLCESYNRQHGTNYRSLMPTNLYGPGDSYHPENSHVIPGLIRRFHEAKVAGADSVDVWGTGQVRREFLHVDDLASAVLHVMESQKEVVEAVTTPMCSHVNVGSGSDLTISELAIMVKQTVGFEGELVFDATKPDGTPQKLMSSSKIYATGWTPAIELRAGLADTYKLFCESLGSE